MFASQEYNHCNTAAKSQAHFILGNRDSQTLQQFEKQKGIKKKYLELKYYFKKTQECVMKM